MPARQSYEWAHLSGWLSDGVLGLPSANAWELELFDDPPGPDCPYFEMKVREDLVMYCLFERQFQDDVWIYRFELVEVEEEPRSWTDAEDLSDEFDDSNLDDEDSLSCTVPEQLCWIPPDDRFDEGPLSNESVGRRIAVRPIPTPLVLNCDLTLTDRREFQAVFFNLAGREVTRVNLMAESELNMAYLHVVVRGFLFVKEMMQSRNQDVQILVCGCKNIVEDSTLLFDCLMQGERPGQEPPQPELTATRKRKAA